MMHHPGAGGPSGMARPAFMSDGGTHPRSVRTGGADLSHRRARRVRAGAPNPVGPEVDWGPPPQRTEAVDERSSRVPLPSWNQVVLVIVSALGTGSATYLLTGAAWGKTPVAVVSLIAIPAITIAGLVVDRRRLRTGRPMAPLTLDRLPATASAGRDAPSSAAFHGIDEGTATSGDVSVFAEMMAVFAPDLPEDRITPPLLLSYPLKSKLPVMAPDRPAAEIGNDLLAWIADTY